MDDHFPRSSNVDGALGHHTAQAGEIRDGLAERFAPLRMGCRRSERCLRYPDTHRTQHDSPVIQNLHRLSQAVPLITDEAVRRDLAILKKDFRRT